MAAAAVLVAFPYAADAAVHPYNTEYFYSVGDAFIFRGGREGLFESKSEVRVRATRKPMMVVHCMQKRVWKRSGQGEICGWHPTIVCV